MMTTDTTGSRHGDSGRGGEQGTPARRRVDFDSSGTGCVGWHYPGTNGACVVMAGGFGVPRGPATDLFAHRFHQAGFSVLAFDYRGVGDSGGVHGVVSAAAMRDDWRAALTRAAALPEVDADSLAVWGFSATGGVLLELAAVDDRVAAAIVQAPNVGGFAAIRNALRHQTAGKLAALILHGLRDRLRGLLGRPPELVPLIGPRGSVALVTSPDAFDGPAALQADRYPEWTQTVAARSALDLAGYSPRRFATRIGCPTLMVVCRDDQTAPPAASEAVARQVPDVEVLALPGGHYAPFLDQHQPAVAAELAFLQRRLLQPPAPA